MARGIRRGFGGPLGAIGAVRTLVGVVREINFDEVRREAELPPRILILGPDEDAAQRLAELLTGSRQAGAVATRTLETSPRDAQGYDAVVIYDPDRTGAIERLRRELPRGDGAVPLVVFTGVAPEDQRAADGARLDLVRLLPEQAPAFGRAYPPFRPAAVKAVIDETAKANAQFALVSNIPAVVPIVGSFAAAGADFLVLTKNQAMMFFKVAAIHGRDLRDQWGIIRELIPVVGAGFFWRTLAREAASFIPLAAGTIPKVAIAYAGTVSAGRAADFYYRKGIKPSRDQLMTYYRQGAEAVKSLPLPRGGEARSQDGEEASREEATETTPSDPVLPEPGAKDAGLTHRKPAQAG